ncbi:MAG: metallophosphoesterase family protein [Planctomycetota bacterium]|jgi:hypothetical protein
MRRAVLLLLLGALLLPACVRPDLETRFTPAWEPFDPSGEGWIATRQALLCADCQFHNLYSKPLPERNLSAEALAATAIRPPQLDLFSPDVLAWILKNGTGDTDVILHLGDAVNLATTGEFDAFLEVMAQTDLPWFMAPGNHDVFYLGTYPAKDPELTAAAAYQSGEALGKDLFIRLYVGVLLRQKDPGCVAFARMLGVEPKPDAPLLEVAEEVPSSFEWRADADAPGLLRRICWKIDEKRPWRSFIMQSIDLSDPTGEIWKTSVYLLDSCQFTREPTMAPNAWRSYPASLNCGLTGEMLPDQLRKIREWLDTRADKVGTVLACHHPFDTLAPRTRSSIGWIWREYGIGMMVTAHTHHGFFAHHDVGGERGEIELNVGSTSDWPMEWRTLQGFAHLEKRQLYIHAVRNTLVDVLRRRGGFFEPGWEIPVNAPDDYRRYKQGESAKGMLVDAYVAYHYTPPWFSPPRIRANKAARHTEEQIKNTLLWTFHRLINEFPTDPEKEVEWPTGCRSDREVANRIQSTAGEKTAIEKKIALLMELNAFERSRSTRDPASGASTDDVRERYKISQAAWASRFMAERGRRLRTEDDLISVDWDSIRSHYPR